MCFFFVNLGKSLDYRKGGNLFQSSRLIMNVVLLIVVKFGSRVKYFFKKNQNNIVLIIKKINELRIIF